MWRTRKWRTRSLLSSQGAYSHPAIFTSGVLAPGTPGPFPVIPGPFPSILDYSEQIPSYSWPIPKHSRVFPTASRLSLAHAQAFSMIPNPFPAIPGPFPSILDYSQQIPGQGGAQNWLQSNETNTEAEIDFPVGLAVDHATSPTCIIATYKTTLWVIRRLGGGRGGGEGREAGEGWSDDPGTSRFFSGKPAAVSPLQIIEKKNYDFYRVCG